MRNPFGRFGACTPPEDYGPAPTPGSPEAQRLASEVKPTLLQLLWEILQNLRRPKGEVLANLLSLELLPPEVARVDMLRFQASITNAGVVTSPGLVSLNSNYKGDLWGMSGYVQDPATDFDDLRFVTANFQEDGKNFNLFTSDINMAQLVGTTGLGPIIEYPRGTYVFSKGARVSGTFFCDTTGYAVTNTKAYGICLYLNLVRAEE